MPSEMAEVRVLQGQDDALMLLDQTRLPAEETYVVRGAPALGAVDGYGVAVVMLQAERGLGSGLRADGDRQVARCATYRCQSRLGGRSRTPPCHARCRRGLAEARRFLAEDTAENRQLARIGTDGILTQSTRPPLRVVIHGNTGAPDDSIDFAEQRPVTFFDGSAAERGIPFASVCLIANPAAGLSAQPITIDEVTAVVAQGAEAVTVIPGRAAAILAVAR
jgi:hypothetical protein